ncbi:hypothetical protein CSUI_007194, partial [Cystoisospora suis]
KKLGIYQSRRLCFFFVFLLSSFNLTRGRSLRSKSSYTERQNERKD